MFCDEPKLRKVVGRVWFLQVCSVMTDTDMLSRTFLGELFVTVILVISYSSGPTQCSISTFHYGSAPWLS